MNYGEHIQGRTLFTYSFELEKIADEIQRLWSGRGFHFGSFVCSCFLSLFCCPFFRYFDTSGNQILFWNFISNTFWNRCEHTHNDIFFYHLSRIFHKIKYFNRKLDVHIKEFRKYSLDNWNLLCNDIYQL